MIRDRDPVLDVEEVSVQALMFLASHDDLMRRFLDLTGLEADGIRAAAAKLGFFVDLLDFFLANEADVIDLASQLHMRPETIGRARNQLAVKAGVPLVELAS